ncbi:ribosome small subunit-dependent GTPase A [Nitrosospira sp. NRS527]|uniref:ribosome small subunit-dependent GTPase A n=1 Tax=Nitrosospira sp. NRS527 TaxID=155925 RepID=UPI001FD22A61|nr:ribosome small subunit-dependent GTPase A [Nitrosospira sp. NRS527]
MRTIRQGPTASPITGQIVAAFGRSFLVKTVSGAALSCVMRGKKGGVACGDVVEIQPTESGQGVIENIMPRSALLYRSDAFREKLIAANITQVIIVVAAVPSFSEELINRCIAAAENQRIKVLIVLNKADLIQPTNTASNILSLYRELGYSSLQLSAKTNIEPLLPHLHGHLSVLVGQSGMGKSTLINALIPAAERATSSISVALDTGRHTTTHARLYHLDDNSRIIDSPGMQEFGLHHIDRDALAWGFVEFRQYMGLCRFNNCRHANEPGCALVQAVQEGKISARRLAFYQKLAK